MAKDKTEKKGGKGKVVAIVLAVLLVIGIIGSVGGEDSGDAGDVQQPSQQSQQEPSGDQGGEAVNDSVDKSLLEGIVENAKGNDGSEFTDESYEVLVAAIEAADAVIADGAATQEQVDEAREAVTDAVSALVEKDPLTMGEQMAVEKAGDYLSVMHFSKAGLADQLEFEGFTPEEAAFAVDYLSVDWNEQAAGKAQDYIDVMSFSKQGLIDQLVFEGFTQEQAEYGAAAVGY